MYVQNILQLLENAFSDGIFIFYFQHLQQSEVKHTENDTISKAQVLNETNLIYDLLIFALTRRDQYLQLSNVSHSFNEMSDVSADLMIIVALSTL